ncbi:SCO4402 family protein [Streptomyces sindenensis]|uniref:SCO4402 family protein n=1 Tax=Streptomyces sindenensis TaxID=67363 RepID=UPI004032A18F
MFDDFCDAEHPEHYLGTGLRSEEEAVLLRELDRALAVAEDQAPGDSDAEILRVEGWGGDVVAVAGRPAQVMVANDLGEILALDEARGAAEA